MADGSRLSGFYKQSIQQRRQRLVDDGVLQEGDAALLERGGIDVEAADVFSENVLGVLALPFSVATNFRINDRDRLVPMCIEEPSVVAAASNAARLVREGGGFIAEVDDPIMIAQVELRGFSDREAARNALVGGKDRIIEQARQASPDIESFGGGIRDLELRDVDLRSGEEILVVHLMVDCADAMGANTVNTMAEAASGSIAELTGGRTGLRILSNLADRRLARARCIVPLEALAKYRGAGDADPARVRDGVIAAWELADADPYRAATHNKGIMNGVDAVALATGNDFRALEAGAHAFASREGSYSSLSRWAEAENGALTGILEMPAAVGTVGGMTRYHGLASRALDIMGGSSAADLAEVIVCAGLATNLAALLALSTEGIQRGHMRLHAKRV